MHDENIIIAQMISNEPLDQWWTRQAEQVGKGGCVILNHEGKFTRIHTIEGKDWEGLTEMASRLMELAGRALGLEEWEADRVASLAGESHKSLLVSMLAGKLGEARAIVSASFEPDHEPPF